MDKNIDPLGGMGQNADDYFDSIRKAQGESAEEPQGRELAVEEDRKMQDGFALEEMMKSAGWAVIADILQNMPKAHVDPRGMTEDEWKFAELNAFWQGQVAKELQDGLYFIVGEAHRLHGIKVGTVKEARPMKL